MSKIAIIGAGAIGGLVGARLALAGEEVTFLVRGANLQAIQQQAITLVEADGTRHVAQNVRATNDYRAAGVQDVVVLGMKAHQVAAVLGDLPHLIGPETIVVPMQNGIPFWYFHRHGGPLAGHALRSVDPTGACSRYLDARRIVGSVVYPAAEVPEPGVIELVEGDRFTLGEPSGEKTPRIERLSQALIAAGLKAPIRAKIRDEIWIKLWGNLSFNPISALTCATLDVICTDPGTRALARAMMVEAQTIALKLGVRFPIPVDKRLDGGAAVGAHKTSMLQDLERGRPMEIDALVTAVADMGRLVAVPTPAIDAVLALVRLRARIAGCYA